MLDKIRKNLSLKVDYHKNATKSGISLPGVTFFVIGTLPVLIVYENGEQEVAKLYAHDNIKEAQKDMRFVFGKKATDEIKLKNYRQNINTICKKLEYVI